ncbi:hypothetical protein [Paracoccus yeei]|uniref:Mobilization protein C (MobC) n=1 Tax=Paracoccus yeei TaxID=147645 RepID=A0A0D5A0S7_9RHOB|nr:hypothetical protein [Paracoccus yeei]AJW30092.1 mobilization protein C (MobC) [Paracoccus yeei]
MAETELERAEKRYAQARARLQALKNREAARERKLDTRRKVILGGALIDLAARDSNAAAMLDRLVRNLPRDQDRKTFEGWDARTAAHAPAAEVEGALPDAESEAHVPGETTAATGAAGSPPDGTGLSQPDRAPQGRNRTLSGLLNPRGTGAPR